MTDTYALKHVMQQYSGGSLKRYRHWFNRRFIYTEGVHAMAEEAGAFWLLDVVATEAAPIALMRWDRENVGTHFIEVHVTNETCVIDLVADAGELPLWTRRLTYTTFPEGDWIFELTMDGVVEPGHENLVMLLLEEH